MIPLVIEDDSTVIGFVLLTMPPYTPQGCDYGIHDFFILRKYRSQGLGKIIAKVLFQTYSGKFAMMQLINNQIAISFWKKVLTENGIEYEEKKVMDEGDLCLLQEFEV